MLISSSFCEKNLRLIFTILEMTKHDAIKCSILIYLADLIERFPNSVEPWISKVHSKLTDESTVVRSTAFFVLANLILKDMIRVQSQIAMMAQLIIDPVENLKLMAKEFFTTLSSKTNNLYNALPDVFTHLCEQEAQNEEDLRTIMK